MVGRCSTPKIIPELTPLLFASHRFRAAVTHQNHQTQDQGRAILLLNDLRQAIGQLNFPKRYPIIISGDLVWPPFTSSTIKMMLCDWHNRKEFQFIPTNFLEMHQLSLPHKYMFCNMKKGLSVSYLHLERSHGNQDSVSRSPKVFACSGPGQLR